MEHGAPHGAAVWTLEFGCSSGRISVLLVTGGFRWDAMGSPGIPGTGAGLRPRVSQRIVPKVRRQLVISVVLKYGIGSGSRLVSPAAIADICVCPYVRGWWSLAPPASLVATSVCAPKPTAARNGKDSLWRPSLPASPPSLPPSGATEAYLSTAPLFLKLQAQVARLLARGLNF
jgi:hypothetical protein